jgi:hypothetical protein
VIFEIPLDRSSKRDVIVVWDAFESLASEDRSSIITEAYCEEQAAVSLALGVTYEEALEQQVLPYAIVPKAQTGDVDPDDMRREMLEQGGFATRQGGVDLRFPTMAMAEQACRHLSEKLPKAYWSIVQSPVPVT